MKPGDLLLALLANAAWSVNFLAGKAGVEHFPPLLFSALRFTVLLLLLLPWLRWQPGKMRQVLQISGVLGVLHFSLIFIGLDASGDIASVAIAAQLYVPFSALLAVVWLGERLDRRRVAGITAAFAGVLVIGLDPTVFAHLDALAWIVGAALAMACLLYTSRPDTAPGSGTRSRMAGAPRADNATGSRHRQWSITAGYDPA